MKFEDIKKLVMGLTNDMESLKDKTNPSFKREIKAGEYRGIIDISMDTEKKIPKENFKDKPLIKDYKYWILKLDRYHKNPAMKINQLNTSALKMYAKLGDKLEAELNKEGTTVARRVSELRREDVNYDLYYTLYLIAEAAVINFYNPLANKSANKSYAFLEKATSREIRSVIENEVDILIDTLKEPSFEVREYFNLTEDNQVSLWWDPDGSLREKYNFSNDEVLAINQITKRNNVVWKNKKVYEILIDMYLSTIRAIFDNPEIDSTGLVNIVKPYKQSKLVLDAILIQSEYSLRGKFTFLNWINTGSAIDDIKAYDPKLYNFIRDYQKKYLNDLDFDTYNEINLEYFDKNPNKYQELGRYIEELDTKDQIAILERYEDSENFDKLINHLDKWHTWSFGFIPLYYIYKRKINKPSHEKSLLKFIHEDNVDQFEKLVAENDLSEELIREFEALETKQAKKISMNKQKIADSKKDLKNTVDLVSVFLDDEEEEISDTENQEPISQTEEKTDLEYAEILQKLVDNGSIPVDEMSELARKSGLTLNIFINNINDSLYEYIGDQTLLIEGNAIVIDEFYVDMVREIIYG